MLFNNRKKLMNLKSKYMVRRKILGFILLAFGILYSFQFHSCKKPSQPHDPIDSFLLNNFNYKAGTYWIYIDSLTGEEDSFVVVENVFGSSVSGNSSILTDYLGEQILQFNNLTTKAAWSMTLTGSQIEMEYQGNIQIDYIFFIIIPFKVESLGYNDKDSGYVSSIGNTISVNSQTYIDVAVIRHSNDYGNVFAHFNNTFYFNKDVGIIKMNLNQDVHNIWELERYKIIK